MSTLSHEAVSSDVFWTQYLSLILIIIVVIVAALFGAPQELPVERDNKVASVPLGSVFQDNIFLPNSLEGAVETLTTHDVRGVFYIGSQDVSVGVSRARILKEYIHSRGVPHHAVQVFFNLSQMDGSGIMVIEREKTHES